LNIPIATTHDGKRILLSGDRLWDRMSERIFFNPKS
jgi:hypothetical protein